MVLAPRADGDGPRQRGYPNGEVSYGQDCPPVKRRASSDPFLFCVGADIVDSRRNSIRLFCFTGDMGPSVSFVVETNVQKSTHGSDTRGVYVWA